MKTSNWVGSGYLVAFSRRALITVLAICIIGLPVAYANQEYNHVLTLESPNPENHAWFGYNVKISGDILMISEPYANVGEVPDAGKVYLYDTEGTLIATLQSPTPGPNDFFGETIDIMGDTICIGELHDIENFQWAGRAYIYATNGACLHTIEQPEPSRGGYFGINSVSLGQDLIAVSEIGAETSPSMAGKVHIYDGDGNYLKSLVSPTPILQGAFGSRIEVGDNMILIGEYGRVGSNLPQGSGSVYVFDYEGNHLMTLKAPEPEEHACFGRSISISGDRIVIGEMWATVEGVWRAGRAYIFNTDGELLHTIQSPNLKEGARFGEYLAVDGDRLVVGEWDADVTPGQYEGRAYVYDVDGNLLQSLTSPDLCPRAAFGFGVDINGDMMIIGEPWASTEELGQPGRVHVYRLGPPMVAVFEVGNLAVQPSSVEPDKPVTVSVDVSNTGNKSGAYSVKLMIDGELCEEKEVTVDAGLNEKVTFTYQTSVEGTHKVKIGDLEGNFRVEKPIIPGYPLIAIIAGLVAVSFLAWLKLKWPHARGRGEAIGKL